MSKVSQIRAQFQARAAGGEGVEGEGRECVWKRRGGAGKGPQRKLYPAHALRTAPALATAWAVLAQARTMRPALASAKAWRAGALPLAAAPEWQPLAAP